MDPLSIASGVAGLITLAEVVISRTYNTIIKCKNASEDSCRLLREVQSLLGILQSVSTLEKKLGSSAIQSQIPGQSVAACQKTLQNVRDMLEKADPRADGVTILQRAKRTLKWPISSSHTDEILADMERHKSTFNLAMTADTLDMLLAASEAQATTSTKVDQLEQSLQRLVRVEMTKEARRMLQVLGADGADGYHRSNLQLHHPGTCLWFIDGSAFRDWCTVPRSKLWISGIPGAGKTVLSALAIDAALVNSSKSKVVIFYYCSHQNDRSRLLTGILSCLVGQLARHNEECLAMVLAKFERSGHADAPTWVKDESDLTVLLESMFRCFEEVSILIDGVDECHDASAVSETLAHLCESPNVRMLISSRQEHEMKWFLADFQQTSIAAESQDLRLYVPAEIEIRQKRQKLRIRNPDLKDEMIDKLVNGAQGMFRWVACQLDHLCNLTTDRERLRALKTLPPTLYSTYDQILERLNEKSESACRLVERVLKWLIAPGPGWDSQSVPKMPRISARELCVAISIEEDDATIDVYGTPSVDEIMVHTSSLLRLSQDERYMEFAHFTVEEYLRSIDPQERPELARYRWDESNAATCQIETCLTFLNLEEFRPSLCETLDSFQQFLHTHPFYARASVLWTSYSTLGGISGRAAKSVNKFFGPSDITFAFDNWLQVRLLASHLDDSDRYSDPISALQHGISTKLLARSRAVAASTSKLHIAAMFYLVDLISGLIKTGLQLDALSPFGTALHCALVGEIGMVELMEGSRKTCFKRNIAVSSTISVLLEQGANARIPFNEHPTRIATPLYLAARVCATQQLLDAGAVLDENTVRAIMQDMDDGHDLDLEPLAQLPLDSVNDRDRRYAEQLLMRINPGRVLTASNTTPLGQATLLELDDTLRHACQYNELSVFRWISERHGLDANHRFDSDRSLLHLACESFSADVVAYLIGRGVDPNIKDVFGCSPLVYYFNSSLWKRKTQNRPFIRQNCLATFRCMVGHNVQLQMLTTSGDTALIFWAECRSTELDVLEEILRVLLNQGLDIGSRNAHGMNVWHFLAFHNHFKHLEMLRSSVDDVAFGPSIDVADEEDYTPILYAAKEGSVEMFDFLIEQGCDITSVTSSGQSILHLAAWGIWCKHSMLESLVAKYMHTEIAQLTSDGYTIAHSCVLSITTHHHGEPPPRGIPQRFRKSIESLLSLSISIVDTDLQGETPLDHLCQWIANEGCHGISCDLCKDCFECFEMLIFHCDAKAEPSWTTILLRGLASEAEADPDDSPAAEYPEDTIRSRAICLAMDRGFFLDDLGAELDLDSIFDIAVRLRQESLILKLLDTENMDFDRPSRKEPHLTPLQSLCTHCCPVSTIRVAISRTRNVCRSDSRGQGPLHMLFSNDEAQHAHMAPTIRALLDAGVDIDGRSNHAGRTALMMAAASESSSDAVGTLLSSGAKVDLCDAKGWNALLRACDTGTESAIKELIDAGSPIVHRGAKFKTDSFPKTNKLFCGPIQLAAARGLTDIVKILLPFEETIERSDSNGNPPSPLMMACRGSHVTVRLLLERGYDPNLLDASLGMRPLHVASWAGETEVVHALLESGCDKEAPDQDGIKALVLATMQGHEQIARMLEGTGNDVGQAVSPTRLLEFAEHRNNGPTTTKDSEELPIHSRAMTRYAVCQPQFGRFISRHLLPDSIRPFFVEGSLQVVKSAALSGLNMEGCFKSCTCTPMLVAVSNSHLEIVTYLVSIEVPLLTGDQCSLHSGSEYTVSEILAADPIWAQLVEQWFNRPEWRAQLSRDRILCMIASAMVHNNLGPLDVLLDKIATPFPSCELLVNNCKITPSEFLHLASKESGTAATSCADMLVSRGLDVDCLDRDLRTPLQEASSHGHLDMVKLLLSHNAAVNVANSVTGTALSDAAKKGHVSVIDQLLTSGADPNLCVMPRLAPVTCAAREGQYAAFRVLLNAGGTAKTQDYYDLCDRGYRSVLMLDNEYFCTMQGPDLLHSILFSKSLPIFKSMPLARRIWSLATLMPEKQITSLYYAALDGVYQLVHLMVEYGAVINMEGGPEGTPLMAACVAGHLPAVKYLVQRGALLAYWNGTSHVSAYAKAQRHPKILRWLLVGRFTETHRLTENATGGDMCPDATTEACHRKADEINFQLTLKELVLRHDIEGYLERNFWFVPARRFVDSGHGSFEELDIPPSEFAKYKPGFV